MLKIDRNVPEIETLGEEQLNLYMEYNIDSWKVLKEQDDQMIAINNAENQFKKDNNFDAIIAFWENLFKTTGLKFKSTTWIFRLVNLYILSKRYNNALIALQNVKNKAPLDKWKEYEEYIKNNLE